MNIIINYKKNKIVDPKKLNFAKIIKSPLYFSGSFSIKRKIADRYYLLRDAVGSKKIFYGKFRKKIIFSSSYIKLLKKCNKNSIYSAPKGCLTELDLNGKVRYQNFFKHEEILYKNFNKLFLSKLLLFLKIIKKNFGETCYICLSGGLDSTIIIHLAKKIFKNPIAVCATFKHANNIKLVSNDMEVANKIAKKINIKIVNLKFDYKDILNSLADIMESSQDWRDYNVHCATLNYFIAKKLSKSHKGIPVLTGDMMNEYCADYTTEFYKKKKFYEIPRINRKILQRFLINGLDSSSREIGVFNKFGVTLFLPYCVLSELYKNLPVSILNKKFKYKLNGAFVPKSILKMVSKKKNRAQITDDKGGVLGYFQDNGLDQEKLLKIFSKKFNVSSKWLNNFIVAGQFRVKS